MNDFVLEIAILVAGVLLGWLASVFKDRRIKVFIGILIVVLVMSSAYLIVNQFINTDRAFCNPVLRPVTNEEETYYVECPNVTIHVADLLVVRARDYDNSSFVASILYVVETEDNKNGIALSIFKNPNVDIKVLSGLELDTNVSGVNLERLIPVNISFVGLSLEEDSLIRVDSNKNLAVGDKLTVVKLTSSGDALPLDSPVEMTITNIGTNGDLAQVSWVGDTWPRAGSPLILSRSESRHEISVGDATQTNICVRKGDSITIEASGSMKSGEYVGMVDPEGKERFDLFGFPTPIDPEWDVVPEFPHGALLYRVKNTEEWIGYHKTKQFTASMDGCLEFDVNMYDDMRTEGAYSIVVTVTP